MKPLIYKPYSISKKFLAYITHVSLSSLFFLSFIIYDTRVKKISFQTLFSSYFFWLHRDELHYQTLIVDIFLQFSQKISRSFPVDSTTVLFRWCALSLSRQLSFSIKKNSGKWSVGRFSIYKSLATIFF